ncbi:hypothetical protein ACHAQH_009168 [Verticillium albo-atrum]
MSTPAASKPRVVLISLNHQPYFDEMYSSLLSALNDKAQVQRVKKSGPLIRLLSDQPVPSAVLLTDEALTTRANNKAWEAVVEYVRGGGIAVAMGHFPSFVKPLTIKPFFAKAGLPWERGDYTRTTLALNREAVPGMAAQGLQPQYSQKAVFVGNVASSDSWYETTDDSVVESRVFPLESVKKAGETAVAFATVGMGKLGYVGDVNAETGSDAVVLAMCGLA